MIKRKKGEKEKRKTEGKTDFFSKSVQWLSCGTA